FLLVFLLSALARDDLYTLSLHDALPLAFQKLWLATYAGKQFPFELSGGMARRVLISTAMVSDARLIIADEPTPGLDAPTRKETIRHIEQLTNDGKSLMFITHDISAAL